MHKHVEQKQIRTKKIERKKKLCGKLRVLNGLFIGTPNKNTQWIWQLKQIRFITLFFLSLFTSFIHFLLSRRFIGIEIRLRFCLFEHHTHTRSDYLVLNQFFFTFPNWLNWEDRILAAAAIAFSPMRTFLTNWMTKNDEKSTTTRRVWLRKRRQRRRRQRWDRHMVL